MTLEDRLSGAFRSLESDVAGSADAWAAIVAGTPRRSRRKRLLARLGWWVAPLVAASGIGLGVSGALTPAAPPARVEVVPGPPIPASTTPTPTTPTPTTPTPTTPTPTTPTVASTVPTSTASLPPSTAAGGVPLASVAWSDVAYPSASYCRPFTVRVAQVLYTSPAPDVEAAVVLTTCNNGAGTPSVGLFVYDGAASTTAPTLAATLVSPTDDWEAQSVTAAGATLTLPVDGFSTDTYHETSCLPNLPTTLTWQWQASGYQPTAQTPGHATDGPACFY